MPNPPSYWQNVELKIIVEDLTSVEDLVSVQPNVLLLVPVSYTHLTLPTTPYV